MGKVNKKNALKRKLAVEENDDKKRTKAVAVEEPVEAPKPGKKQKKVEKKGKTKVVEEEPEVVPEVEDEEVEEEMDDEEMDGEEVSDEEGEEDDEDEDEEESDDESEQSGGDFLKETGEKIDFDFEAFPLEDEDKEGINNMLTQIFLRADIDLVGLGKALIAQSPLGCVIGPAEAIDDEDNTTSNVVYGLISMLPQIDKDEKYAKDIFALLKARATKVVSSVAKEFDTALTSAARLGLFVNERMLHFPDAIAAPACKSLLDDVAAMATPPTHVLYIHKIRIVEDENEEKEAPEAATTSGGKKKKGKAEKKRLAAAALAAKDVEYDNGEDAILLQLPTGTAVHFDYQCNSDADPGSKFAMQKKDSITKMPYRRAVIMDLARFKAFLNAVGSV
uniref:Uncharacterized protein n=1 Tax=Pristionchus pacificus TaxID=54126 RepID=A0A2A6CXU0_PRIPA|eukprot:PDM82906.1 hypothetical protein PRIPAC_37299 [Pristionchus pacificus]